MKLKQRFLTAGILLAIFIPIALFWRTIVFEIIIGAMAFLIVAEIMTAVKLNRPRPIFHTFLVYSVLTIFIQNNLILLFITYLLAMITLIYCVVFHAKQQVKLVLFGAFMTIAVTMSLKSLLLLRDVSSGHFFIHFLLATGGGFVCDSFAFFSGSLFGKTKLSPIISPKKTVEGLVGGILATIFFFIVFVFVYSKLYPEVTVNYPLTALLAVVLSTLGTFGDLFASVIKRQNNIKDFSNILAGHGGFYDRFDSIMFTAPAMYIFTAVIGKVIIV